jgi:hypothetical protein
MKQPRLIVPRDVVLNLVRDFAVSNTSYCSSYRPFEIGYAFYKLPEIKLGYVDYHAASRVLDNFRCNKLSGSCDRWTSWMRHRLNDWKEKETPLVPVYGAGK